MDICSSIISKAYHFLLLKEEVIDKKPVSDEEILFHAREELSQAQNLFSMVEDPELIDYAVLKLKAAEQRYNYLFKTIKKKTKLR
jgi:hypothetical protein